MPLQRVDVKFFFDSGTGQNMSVSTLSNKSSQNYRMYSNAPAHSSMHSQTAQRSKHSQVWPAYPRRCLFPITRWESASAWTAVARFVADQERQASSREPIDANLTTGWFLSDKCKARVMRREGTYVCVSVRRVQLLKRSGFRLSVCIIEAVHLIVGSRQ